MKLSEFDTQMPKELIATEPSFHRDEARLMVLHRKTGEIEHKVFKEVLDYFNEDDLFVFNNTRVFPAKLEGNKEKTGAKIEVFLLRELNEENKLWDVLVEPARKIRIGADAHSASSTTAHTTNLKQIFSPLATLHSLTTLSVKPDQKTPNAIKPSSQKRKALWWLHRQACTLAVN